MENHEIAKVLEAVRTHPETVKMLSNQTPVDTLEEAAEIWSKAASGIGHNVSAEEITNYIRESEAEMKRKAQENKEGIESLSEQELEEAAGGKGHDNCEFSFKDRENCWVTDACDNAIIYYGGYLCHKFFKDTCKSFLG